MGGSLQSWWVVRWEASVSVWCPLFWWGGGASGYQDQLSSVRASEYSGGLDPSGRCAAAAAVKSIVDFVRSRPREVGPFDYPTGTLASLVLFQVS